MDGIFFYVIDVPQINFSVSVVFALPPNEQQWSYEVSTKVTVDKCEELGFIDLEVPATNFLKQSVLSHRVRTQGSLLHPTQSTSQLVHDLGLVQRYRNPEEIKNVLNIFDGLVFLSWLTLRKAYITLMKTQLQKGW